MVTFRKLEPRKSFQEITEYTKWFLENYKSLKNSDIRWYDIKWGVLSCQWRMRLPEDFIIRFKNDLNFYELSKRGNFSEEIVRELHDSWNWYILLSYIKNITPECIDKFIKFAPSFNNLYHNPRRANVSEHIKLQDIEKETFDLDYLDWEFISARKDLNQEFIEKYLERLDLESVIEYSNAKKICPKSFINKLKMIVEMTH